MSLFYFALFLYCLPIFFIYIVVGSILSLIKIREVEKGNGFKLYVSKDLIHSDYIFEADSLKEFFPTNNKFIKVGWGDRKIFLETKEWKDLKIVDFLTAFFGLNTTVLRVEYIDEVPMNSKELDINERQLSVLKTHIRESFYGSPIEKKPNYYQKGDYYKSKLRYNCITNCNNWINYGLYMAKLTGRIWCPFSFLI